ncbi:ribonuclease Z [Candidatus Woesearchaeota archaeon]|nr:ribonuclease Z [Candidatus Woesearchaeota archaeon]
MQLIFLGTSCAKPTKERNHSAIFLSYGSDGILFDCGEGTQRQLTIAGIKPPKISKVLISHWHGDHVLGLPGLIQTLGISEYNKTLKIYGPKGTKEYFNHMMQSTEFEERIKVEYIEVEGKFYSGAKYSIEAERIAHKTPTNGYRFIEKDKTRIDLSAVKKLGIPEGPLLGQLQEGKSIRFKGKEISPKDTTYSVKGKIITYIPDSVPSKNSLKLAQDADLLICESTYSSKLEEKAEKYQHMTSKQAGLIANQANVKKLILTHFSTRYKNTLELEEDARSVFDNVIAAEDFMKVSL